jgi:hypothetical protein
MEGLAERLKLQPEDLPGEEVELAARAWREVLRYILPNRPEEADYELFEEAVFIQYIYSKSEDYRLADLAEYKIGDFSAKRKARGRVSPDLRALLLPAGYLGKSSLNAGGEGVYYD